MRPQTQVVQMEYQNPHASSVMYVPVAVICNTTDEQLTANIIANSAMKLDWLPASDPHDGVAIMCGGGASIEDDLKKIDYLRSFPGAAVFAMNAVSQYLRENGIVVDYQVMADAKQETASLVDKHVPTHLFASQVHPDTVEEAGSPILWHLEIGQIETVLPPERVAKGGYALIGGGTATGIAALCVAYAMGYRTFHIFGYDSCHKDGRSHAYPQLMNQFILTSQVEWGDKTYTASVAMKAQAEKFQITAQALEQAGCDLHLYGDGLLQAMYLTPPKDLTERQKYSLMWEMDSYRDVSPGEHVVEKFIEVVKPDGLIVDFGCGTGRAALALHNKGFEVFAVDFTSNCRDDEALCLPFLEWDLNHPGPLSAPYGLCTDVMEHIPTTDVPNVIKNIMSQAKTVFFQISTVPDVCGAMIGTPLHLTVQSHGWWSYVFQSLGYVIAWQEEQDAASLFVVRNMEGE
jgi:hypothetical protein